MILLKLILSFPLTFNFVSCQRIDFGNCPNLLVKKDFDVDKYLGVWYEIEKIPAKFEDHIKCTTANYSLEQDHISIMGRGIEKDGTEDTVSGEMAAPDKNVPAKLIIAYHERPFRVNYWILDTDYKEYAITYSCIAMFRIMHLEYLWIFSRKPSLDAAVTKNVYKWLDDNKIDRKMLQKTDQSCK